MVLLFFAAAAVRLYVAGPSSFSAQAYAAVTGASQHIVAAVRSDFSGTNLWGEVDIEALPEPQAPDAVLSAGAIDAMVRKAIELACIDDGGLSAYFDADDWVCIVLDAGWSAPSPSAAGAVGGRTADLRLVRAFLAALAEERGARRISLVADAPKEFWSSAWEGRYGGLAYESMVEDLAAAYPDIAFDIIGRESFARRDTLIGGESFAVPDAILKCDKCISISTLKGHSGSRVSMNVMNFLQLLPAGESEWNAPESGWERLESKAADVFALRTPRFALVDGIRGFVVDGRNGAHEFRGNIVLAGKDPLAVDAAGSMLVGRNPWDVNHFHLAALKGAGTFDPDSMDFRGTPFNDASSFLRPAIPAADGEYSGRGLRRWLVNGFHEVAAFDETPLEDEPFLYPEPEDEEGGRTWIEYISPGNYVDLAEAAGGNPENGVAYAYTRFLSSVKEEGFAWFRAAGEVALFFNDEEIFRTGPSDRDDGSPHRIAVPVQRGYNHLLVKAGPESGRCGFSLQIVGPENDGNSMQGLKFLEP